MCTPRHARHGHDDAHARHDRDDARDNRTRRHHDRGDDAHAPLLHEAS